MNKKMRELLTKIETKTKEARSYMDGETKDVTKASAILKEVEGLKQEYEVEKNLFDLEKEQNAPSEEIVKDIQSPKAVDSTADFAKAARAGFPKATMTEGTPADGGYTVPEDIQTQINTYRDAKFSLRSLVTVENVTTKSGARTFKSRATQTGFTNVAEAGKIGATATPKFERIEYSIDKYAGYLPVTNELLEDSDANIVNTVVEWLGDEGRVTDNKNILTVAKTFTTRTIAKETALDDIKKILNVDLGQAFKPTSVVVTNDDGLQFLDTLKDADGNYLLQPSPQDPMALVLCAGATTVPVKVVPNADLATDSNNIPFFIGDMKEAIVLWDRNQMTLMTSTVAAIGELNAFEQDLTIWRGILREDVTKRDANALFYATLNVVGG